MDEPVRLLLKSLSFLRICSVHDALCNRLRLHSAIACSNSLVYQIKNATHQVRGFANVLAVKWRDQSRHVYQYEATWERNNLADCGAMRLSRALGPGEESNDDSAQ